MYVVRIWFSCNDCGYLAMRTSSRGCAYINTRTHIHRDISVSAVFPTPCAHTHTMCVMHVKGGHDWKHLMCMFSAAYMCVYSSHGMYSKFERMWFKLFGWILWQYVHMYLCIPLRIAFWIWKTKWQFNTEHKSKWKFRFFFPFSNRESRSILIRMLFESSNK